MLSLYLYQLYRLFKDKNHALVMVNFCTVLSRGPSMYWNIEFVGGHPVFESLFLSLVHHSNYPLSMEI